MPVARPESADARVIAHVDMDCFYVQVEQRKQPELRGLPTAVVQYNEWKGGALIAVSYEARKYGVKRSMRGDEAKEVCPQVNLVQVPVARGKADLNIYRNAGSEVVSILARKGRCERASIDEVYLDLTDASETMLAEAPPESLEVIDEEALKSHILGITNEGGAGVKDNVKEWIGRSDAGHHDKLLACGVLIVTELRNQVLRETEFTCSAGIAHNKMLAKLASGMNKPAQQTVVPFSSVKGLLESLPIKKMKQLGGKLGTSLQTDLGVNTVGDMLHFSEEKLQEHYGINTGTWLWNIARGISGEEVQGRVLPKSHGSGKTFPGPRALKTLASVQHWLNQLCEELSERLCLDFEQKKRIAHTLTLHARAYTSGNSCSHKKFPSKSCPLRYGASKIQEDAFNLFQAALREYMCSYGINNQVNNNNAWRITSLSVSASKIFAVPAGTHSIMKYFHGRTASCPPSRKFLDNLIQEPAPSSPSDIHSGYGSYSELKLMDPQIVPSAEETWMKYPVPVFDQGEAKLDQLKDQGAFCSSSNDAQDLLVQQTTSLLAHDLFIQQTTPLAPLGSGKCSELNKITSHTERSKDEVCIKKRKKEPKGNTLKYNIQGKCSILKFFKRDNQPHTSLEQGHVKMTHNLKSALSQVSSSSESNHNQQPNECFFSDNQGIDGNCRLDQNEERRERCSYKFDEIDPSVIDELPPEIQHEIRAWLHPHKLPNKKGSTIDHYFLPKRTCN